MTRVEVLDQYPFEGAARPWSDRIATLSTNPIIQTDPAGRITWVNRAFETKTGYTAAEAIGRTPGRLLQSAETDQTVVKAIRAALADASPIKAQILNRSKAGQLYWLDLEIQPALDAHGKLEGFLAIQTDITEIMAAKEREHEALEAARLALAARTAYEEALDRFAIVTLTDPNGDIVSVNDKFAAISGFARDELIGKNHRILNSGHHPHAFFADLWQTIASGRPWHGEICNRTKGGDLYWVDTTIMPLAGSGGSPQRYLSIHYDVTHRKTAEEQRAVLLKALNERSLAAEAASVAKGQFLANMSHELRTPMNGVIGMLDLLMKTNLDPGQTLRASTALSSARNLLVILNDILDLSKIERGLVAMDTIPYQPAALIKELGLLLQDRAAEKDICLTWNLAPDMPDWVTGDPTRVRQVLINLVGNALKFTAQGEVAVFARYDPSGSDGMLTFAVRDTGIGLSAEAEGKIFSRFVQADATTTRRFGGAGLGLAISRELAQLMGGDVQVESREGIGSTFTFTVKASVAEGQGPKSNDDATLTVFDRPLRILAADDHKVNRMVIQMYLELAGHTVTLVENGSQALTVMAEQTFDLILMDIQMPIMDGLTAARKIRALPHPQCDVPIIALTANAMAGDREKYLAEGMNDYVAKPIDHALLLTVVARASARAAQSAAA